MLLVGVAHHTISNVRTACLAGAVKVKCKTKKTKRKKKKQKVKVNPMTAASSASTPDDKCGKLSSMVRIIVSSAAT